MQNAINKKILTIMLCIAKQCMLHYTNALNKSKLNNLIKNPKSLKIRQKKICRLFLKKYAKNMFLDEGNIFLLFHCLVLYFTGWIFYAYPHN